MQRKLFAVTSKQILPDHRKIISFCQTIKSEAKRSKPVLDLLFSKNLGF